MGFSAYRQSGLTHNDGEGTYDGYTLITPQGGSETLLLNMEGRIVHAWEFTDFLPGYGRLLDNVNLLLRGVERDLWDEDTLCWIEGDEDDEKPLEDKFILDIRVREMGANASLIREVDWDGNAVCEYKNKRIHHDFVKLANGHAVLAECGASFRGGGPR